MRGTQRPLPPELMRVLEPYAPAVRASFAATRAMLLELAPDATELVYDSYNAVAAAYSFTGHLRDAFCHIAAYSGHVNLGFNHGAELDDPAGILQGAGKRIRHVRMPVPARAEEQVRALIRQAVARAPKHDAAPGGATIVRPAPPRKRRPGQKRDG